MPTGNRAQPAHDWCVCNLLIIYVHRVFNALAPRVASRHDAMLSARRLCACICERNAQERRLCAGAQQLCYVADGTHVDTHKPCRFSSCVMAMGGSVGHTFTFHYVRQCLLTEISVCFHYIAFTLVYAMRQCLT